MQTLGTYLPYIQIVVSLLIIGAVLLEQSSGAIGGAFGGGDNFATGFHTRRGFERVLLIGTTILAILFIVISFITLLINK